MTWFLVIVASVLASELLMALPILQAIARVLSFARKAAGAFDVSGTSACASQPDSCGRTPRRQYSKQKWQHFTLVFGSLSLCH